MIKLLLFLLLNCISLADSLNKTYEAKYSLEFNKESINPYQLSFNLESEVASNLFSKLYFQHKESGFRISDTKDSVRFFLNYKNVIEPTLRFEKEKIKTVQNKTEHEISLENLNIGLKLVDKISLKASKFRYKDEYKSIKVDLRYVTASNESFLLSFLNEDIANTLMLSFFGNRWRIELGGMLDAREESKEKNRFCYHVSWLPVFSVDRVDFKFTLLSERKREKILDLIRRIDDKDIEINDKNLDVSWNHNFKFSVGTEFEKISFNIYLLAKFANELGLYQVNDNDERICLKHIAEDVDIDTWGDEFSENLTKYLSLKGGVELNILVSIFNLNYSATYDSLKRLFIPKFRQNLSLGVDIYGCNLEYFLKYRSDMEYYELSYNTLKAGFISDLSLSFLTPRLKYMIKVNNMFDSEMEYKHGEKIEGRTFSVELGFIL